MQKSLASLLFLSLGISGTFAHADFPDIIEEANRQIKGAGWIGNAECLHCSMRQTSPEEQIKKCVERLCPDENFSIENLRDQTYDKAVGKDPVFETQIAPIVEEIAKENARANIQHSQDLLIWLKTAPTLRNAAEIRAFNLFAAIGYFEKFKFNETPVDTKIDRKLSRKEFPLDSNAEFERKFQIATLILDEYAVQYIPQSNPEELRMLYPGDELTEMVQILTAEIRKRAGKISASEEFKSLMVLPEFRDIVSEKNLNRVFSSGHLNLEAIVDLNRTMTAVSILEKAVSDKHFRKLLTTKPIQIPVFAKTENWVAKIEEEISTAQKFLKDGSPILFDRCKSAYSLGQDFLPSQGEIDRFKTKETSLKEKFKTQIRTFLSSESQSSLNPTIDSWNFNYPMTKAAHMENLKQSLKIALDSAKTWKESSREVDRSKHKPLLYALSGHFVGSGEITDNADDICDELVPELISDAAYAPNRGFIVGPIALRQPGAEGIIYHEMAHLLYATLKSQKISSHTGKWFNKTLACLPQNHEPKTSKYLNEDWADLISSQVWDKSNSTCLFTRATYVSDYEDFSLKNLDPDDTHSSHFFRLLHMSFLKNGKLEPECESVLRQQKQKSKFQNCSFSK